MTSAERIWYRMMPPTPKASRTPLKNIRPMGLIWTKNLCSFASRSRRRHTFTSAGRCCWRAAITSFTGVPGTTRTRPRETFSREASWARRNSVRSLTITLASAMKPLP